MNVWLAFAAAVAFYLTVCWLYGTLTGLFTARTEKAEIDQQELQALRRLTTEHSLPMPGEEQ